MTNDPSSGRPARPDEVQPSDDMREADVTNGEPGAASGDGSDRPDGGFDEEHATTVVDDPTAGAPTVGDPVGGESGTR